MASKWASRDAGEHTCDCGAVYHKTVTRMPIRQTDRAFCDVCAAELDSWSSVFVPAYERAEATVRRIA